MTCSAKFTLFSSTSILLLATLGVVSCSTTPTNESATSEDTAQVTPSQDDSANTATQIYEIDGPESVEVTNLPTPPEQNDVVLKASAPTEYVVQSGDTLWDISEKFLNRPWYWPEIWYSNSQIANPHLIYPGDVITVFYVGGKPYITVGDGPRLSGDATLSPHVRSEVIDDEIAQIPIQAIQQLLIKPRIISKEELDSAPYIVGSSDNRLIYAAGDSVYVRGLDEPEEGLRFSVFRAGNEFLDPDTNELLGFEVIQVGDGEIIDTRQPATLELINSEREALRGDHLLPVEASDQSTAFYPKAPDVEVSGKIISLFDAISQVGTYQVVTTNLGERDGIKRGDVVSIAQAGKVVSDPHADKHQYSETVQLPSEESGVAMVFRTFEKVSYALIMNATVPIRIGDLVTNPR